MDWKPLCLTDCLVQPLNYHYISDSYAEQVFLPSYTLIYLPLPTLKSKDITSYHSGGLEKDV